MNEQLSSHCSPFHDHIAYSYKVSALPSLYLSGTFKQVPHQWGQCHDVAIGTWAIHNVNSDHQAYRRRFTLYPKDIARETAEGRHFRCLMP